MGAGGITMSRITRALAALMLTLALAAAAPASAQALDFEAGHEWTMVIPRAYGIARLNVPLGSAFGVDAWLLPELAAFVPYAHLGTYPTYGYARLQVLFDAPAATFFVDGQADTFGIYRLRSGVRFGFDLR